MDNTPQPNVELGQVNRYINIPTASNIDIAVPVTGHGTLNDPIKPESACSLKLANTLVAEIQSSQLRDNSQFKPITVFNSIPTDTVFISPEFGLLIGWKKDLFVFEEAIDRINESAEFQITKDPVSHKYILRFDSYSFELREYVIGNHIEF